MSCHAFARFTLLSLFLGFSNVIYSLELETDFSGFGRLTAGYLDDNTLGYQGYSNEVTAKPSSLLGLQGSVAAGEKWRLTALGLLSHKDKWEGNLEWLYLAYRPVNNLNIKLGRMHTPFFKISDTLDVGYAYHWVAPPGEVYRDSMVRYFEGVNVQYNLVFDDVLLNTELYYGNYNDETLINGLLVDLELKDLTGYIVQLKWQDFSARASYHTADVAMKLSDVAQLESGLRQAGLTQSANSLNTDGTSAFYQVGLDYHSLDYFAWVEWTKAVPSQDLFANSIGQYVGFGKYLGEVSLALTHGRRRDGLPDSVSGEIPIGASAQLDALNDGYQGIIQAWPVADSQSWTLSSRWEFSDNIALKGELSHIEESNPVSTTFSSSTGPDESTLLLLSVEWIF